MSMISDIFLTFVAAGTSAGYAHTPRYIFVFQVTELKVKNR
jgi:hypothetical protein